MISTDSKDLAKFFPGNSEMARRMRKLDWSRTDLGHPDSWCDALKIALGICLTSRFPMVIWWGERETLLYNDGWRPILGPTKDARALGSPGREIWPEIWDVIGPMFKSVRATGEATWSDDGLLLCNRHGYVEEAYFTWSYSPIFDENGDVGGVFTAVTETTERVLNERRLRTLRDLAAATRDAKTVHEACCRSAEVLEQSRHDIPFALFYLIDHDRKQADLLCAAGIAAGDPASPARIDLTDAASWPLARVVASGKTEMVENLSRQFADLPCGPWPEPPNAALLQPVLLPGRENVFAVLVAAINPRRALDEPHRFFHERVVAQATAAIAAARGFEEEQNRLEALAQLDRAKTTFFSNVSHEFRTPLTLILGPAEEMLSGALGETTEIQRAHLATLRHNAVRLQKLVNTLLDFARVEAGRIEATYEPVDIGLLTRDLASTFCSAVHRAGLLYVVNCPSIDEPVYVDKDMWEKVVLNLLSNALKFTFDGAIEVSVESMDERVALIVRDTGVGISADELPHLFDRFHRVQGSRARTQEGSGIGLALVQELVKLNGGHLEVESGSGAGSTFKILIPKGCAHLPKERLNAARTLSSTAMGAAPFVEEALRWFPDGDEEEALSVAVFTAGPPLTPTHAERILVADDNSEMRRYLRRLLGAHWHVTVVEDGARALEAARMQPPDLILSDVMMPTLGGFDLLRELRADERTSTIPVILLSARAGEEAKVEGLNAGADDYLVKPFAAKELLARVEAHLKLHVVRREAAQSLRASEERYRRLVALLPAGLYTCASPSGAITYFNDRAVELWGRTPAIGDSDEHFCGSYRLWRSDGSFLPHDQTPMALAVREGREFRNHEVVIERPDGTRITVLVNIDVVRDNRGRLVGAINVFQDVTALKRAEQERAELLMREREARDEAETLNDVARTLAAELDLEKLVQSATDAATKLTGAKFGAFFYNVVNEAGESYLLYSLSGAPREAFEKFGLPRNTPIFKPTFDGDAVVRSDDITKHESYGKNPPHHGMPKGHLPVRSYLAAPVISRSEEVLGGIFFGHPEPGVFTERAERLATGIAAQAAIAIDNARLYAAAQKEIAERKEGEQRLRASEERFRTMADSSPIMIWMTDPSGNISFLNRAYREYFGIVADQTAVFDWSEKVHPEDRESYADAFWKALQERQALYQRARLRHFDGQWHWFESRGNPILDGTGNMTGYIGSSSDITDIYESQRKLKELDLRKDEFLANMSHEIRSPLTGIMGYTDILLTKLKDPEDVDCLRTIKECGDYLIEIVNDILDLSKIEAGKLLLNFEDVAVHSVLAEIQTLMDVRAKLKSLPLILRYEGVLPASIHTDRTRLRQILVNLVSNAIKFTERGTVEMVAKFFTEDDLLQVEVIDTGIGIAAEHQERLFQPFSQGDSTSTREYGGTGLGLAITRRLVEMLGGGISFESEPGRGSTFRIIIPAGTVQAVPKPTEPRPQVSPVLDDLPLRNRHVLVVDDRQEICYLVNRYIKDAGGRPAAAADGEAAIAAIEAAAPVDPFDAVILDIQMPGMDGYEVARTLRRKGFPTPIIALTAGAMVGDREKCLHAGCNDYLTKPIDRRKLVQVVASQARRAGQYRDAGSGKVRVLLVDDSHAACKLLSGFLEARGYEVRSAYDGESALPIAREFHPDVVLLDIRLPDMSGHELMERLKDLDSINGAKFIGLSGYRGGDDPAATKFDHFFEKPLSPANLEALLRSLAQ